MSLHRALSICLVALPALTFLHGASAQGPALKGDMPAFKVGDTWRWVRSDKRTGVQEAETVRTLTAVAADRIEGTENSGNIVLDGEGSAMESPEWTRTGASPRFFAFPLAVGKKWSFDYVQKGKTTPYTTRWQYDAEVMAVEKVKVPAGEFDAFKVVYKGYWNNQTGSGGGSATVTNWYAPAARATVRTEFDSGRNSNRTELMELKLQP
jgi:hypothetical protein